MPIDWEDSSRFVWIRDKKEKKKIERPIYPSPYTPVHPASSKLALTPLKSTRRSGFYLGERFSVHGLEQGRWPTPLEAAVVRKAKVKQGFHYCHRLHSLTRWRLLVAG